MKKNIIILATVFAVLAVIALTFWGNFSNTSVSDNEYSVVKNSETHIVHLKGDGFSCWRVGKVPVTRIADDNKVFTDFINPQMSEKNNEIIVNLDKRSTDNNGTRIEKLTAKLERTVHPLTNWESADTHTTTLVINGWTITSDEVILDYELLIHKDGLSWLKEQPSLKFKRSRAIVNHWEKV